MEQYLLQIFIAFFVGLILGVGLMLLLNKLRGGSASPGKVKQEFDDYQEQVEAHFEATSNKFKDMTEQYQDLYKHLSVGATSLCRPDSVAATLVDSSESVAKLSKQPSQESTKSADKTVVADSAPVKNTEKADSKAPVKEPTAKTATPPNSQPEEAAKAPPKVDSAVNKAKAQPATKKAEAKPAAVKAVKKEPTK